jgi:hypothetical protein
MVKHPSEYPLTGHPGSSRISGNNNR